MVELNVIDLKRNEVENPIEIAKKKNKGQRYLKSKVIPHYAANLDREYERITRAFTESFEKVVKRYEPKLERAVRRLVEPQRAIRGDAFEDETVDGVLEQILMVFDQSKEVKNLGNVLEALASMSLKMSVRNWHKIVYKTLGVNIFDDYYLGDFFKENINIWIDNNVSLIKSIPNFALDKMKKIIYDDWNKGKTITQVMKDIQTTYGVSKRKASLIARDQMAKLTADISQAQMQDAGVNQYVWSTSKDQRVRPSHRRLEGKTFSWDNPPIVDEKTGRRCHPAQDYQCRCVAIPKFDLENLNLPLYNGFSLTNTASGLPNEKKLYIGN